MHVNSGGCWGTYLLRCPRSTRELCQEWSRHTGRWLTDPPLDDRAPPALISSSPQLDGTLSGRQRTHHNTSSNNHVIQKIIGLLHSTMNLSCIWNPHTSNKPASPYIVRGGSNTISLYLSPLSHLLCCPFSPPPNKGFTAGTGVNTQ